jgi:hypothetical protein
MEVYHGLAAVGRTVQLISLIVAGIVSLILIVIGIYLVSKKEEKIESTNATVINATCTPSKNNYDCNLNVKYKVKSEDQVGSIATVGKLYKSNDKLDVQYYEKDATKLYQNIGSSKTLGIILIVVAIVILIFYGIYYWLTHTYEAVAAVDGASFLTDRF